jgi:hypothetical protein
MMVNSCELYLELRRIFFYTIFLMSSHIFESKSIIHRILRKIISSNFIALQPIDNSNVVIKHYCCILFT